MKILFEKVGFLIDFSVKILLSSLNENSLFF